MINRRWFNIFTMRERGVWVHTPIPADPHLWDLLVALWSRGAFTGPI